MMIRKIMFRNSHGMHTGDKIISKREVLRTKIIQRKIKKTIDKGVEKVDGYQKYVIFGLNILFLQAKQILYSNWKIFLNVTPVMNYSKLIQQKLGLTPINDGKYWQKINFIKVYKILLW